jgi:hypothetical protein
VEKHTARVLTTVGALGALVTVAIVGSAMGAGLKTESKSVAVPVDETAAATAKCKQDQKVISGGFESVNFDPTYEDAGHLPYASFRPGKRSWTAAAANYGDEGTLVAYAYCRGGKGLKARSTTVEVPGDEAATATASCKPNEKAISGGYDIPNLVIQVADPFTYENRKDGKRGWTASAFNYSDQEANLTTYVYCRQGKGVKTKSDSVPVESFSDVGTATAKCKRGQRVVAGGFDNPDFEAGVIELLPFASRKQGQRKWTASAYSEDSEPGQLTVYAYCEKKQKKK